MIFPSRFACFFERYGTDHPCDSPRNPAALVAELRSEIDAVVARVLVSGRYILGEEVELFEQEWASCDLEHAVGCANGTDALELILRSSICRLVLGCWRRAARLWPLLLQLSALVSIQCLLTWTLVLTDWIRRVLLDVSILAEGDPVRALIAALRLPSGR